MSAPASTASLANKFLGLGLAGLAATALGFLVSPAQHVAMSYLVGVSYWVAIAIGMLLLGVSGLWMWARGRGVKEVFASVLFVGLVAWLAVFVPAIA